MTRFMMSPDEAVSLSVFVFTHGRSGDIFVQKAPAVSILDLAKEEGFPPDRVIKPGSPMFEVLNYYRPNAQGSQIVRELGLEKNKYLRVSAQREENVDPDDKALDLMQLLNTLGDRFDEPVVVSTRLRAGNRIEEFGLPCHRNVRLLTPFGFFDYVNLQINAHIVLPDSETITEESSIPNFPALNIRARTTGRL